MTRRRQGGSVSRIHHGGSGSRATGRLALVVLALLVTACGGGAAPTVYDPNLPPTGPLTALSECGPLPEPVQEEPVEGAQLPADAIMTSVTEQGPLTTITAEVRTTPVNVRLAYEARDDIELIIVEDEVFEAELLVTDGQHRTYIKASAICQTGTTVLAIVAAEDADAPLPVPAGQATFPTG